MGKLRTVAVAVAAAFLLAACGASGGGGASVTRTVARTVTKPAATTTRGRSTTSRSRRSSTSTATVHTATVPTGPVPSGFNASSFTAISDTTWWLLGRAPHQSPTHTAIIRTTDGGRSFVGIPAPATSKVSELRFATAEDGYAFGPKQLWSTDDGGAHWQRLHIGGGVRQLAAAGGYVYAVVSHGNDVAALKRAAVGSDSWSTVRVLPHLPQSALWVQGSTVYVATLSGAGNRGQLLVSHNAGASFATAGKTPSGLACSLSTPPGMATVIWAACATGMMAEISRSSDGGASFRSADGNREFANSVQMAPFAAGGAVASGAADSGQGLYRTTDGGKTWHELAGLPRNVSWDYLGFTDATHGVALETPERGPAVLYYTTDAGASYHRVALSGS